MNYLHKEILNNIIGAINIFELNQLLLKIDKK